jgi:serine/threonine protein kinase
MLVFNPEKRYTVKQCLKHPYFEGLHNEEAEPECELRTHQGTTLENGV